jgi:L-aminopeptidase/D-esterase-like protein
MRFRVIGNVLKVSFLVAVVVVASPLEGQQTASPPRGVRVGHHTLEARPTGCTVVVFDSAAVAGVDVRGSAPGTRETDLLDPVNLVERVNAIVLSGGSAYGLDAASGVMRYLEEHLMGYSLRDDPPLVVPIVPAAILLDLSVGDDPSIRPDAQCGYAAAVAASGGPVEEGTVGAGAGATVGKLAGMEHAMKGGIGAASLRFSDGLEVFALAAVNALGDVIDPATGEVVAGARGPDGFLDARQLMRRGEVDPGSPAANTSLAIVVTNASLTKAQATKIAQMAHDGFARSIYPSHTPYDGDVIFAAGTGTLAGVTTGHEEVLRIGALAADAVARAVLRAVRQAQGLEGFPSVTDLQR